MPNTKSAILLLRLSLAFSFFYAAISSFANPQAWIGWFPEFIFTLAPFSPDIVLNIFSIFEIILGLWLLSNWKTFYAAIVSAVVLFGIVIFNLNQLLVVFRDISIFGAALALAILTRK